MAASPLQLNATLLKETRLTEEDLQQALRKQEESGRRLTDLLLDLDLVGEGELLTALGSLYGIPVRDSLGPDDIDHDLVRELPISFAKQHHILPLSRDETRLVVAIADPLLTDPLDDLRLVFPGVECHPVLATRRSIMR